MALTNQDSRSKSALNRQGSRAETNAMQSTECKTKSKSGRGRPSDGLTSDPENPLSVSGIGIQSEAKASDPETSLKHDKSTFIRAVSMMKTKQVKGMITGMGKELRRAATSVSERLPNPTKKKNEEKQRQALLGAEALQPQARNPDEIKKAYGHSTDVRQAASITQDKLRERGEKLSDIQRRTAEMEADAANFSSLSKELAQKMESKKWYEI